MANPVTHLEKTIAGEVSPVTHLEKVIAEYGGGGGGGGFTPTDAQLDAMNSGITEEDVEQISTNKNNISLKQDIIDSSHKLNADLVDDSTATNKFATAAQLQQIETNKGNILTLQQKSTQVLPSGGKEYLEISLVSDSTNNRGIFLLSIPYQSGTYASCLYMITVGVGTGISGTGIVAYTRIDTQESPDVIAVTISADKKKLFFQVQANSWAQPVIIPMFNPENQPTITANWRDSLPT